MTSDLFRGHKSALTPKSKETPTGIRLPDIIEALKEERALMESKVPKENLNFRSKLDEIFISLSSPKGKIDGRALRISLLGVKVCRRHLSWWCLFKGITVLEWFILEYLLESYLAQGSEDSCACLAGVLSLSSGTRKSAEDWSTQLRPIHKNLGTPCNYGSGVIGRTLLEFVISSLGIPEKGMSKTSLYNVQEVSYSYKQPRESSRIGVGYKDKGSLTPNHELKFVILPGEEWTPCSNSVLSASLNKWKKISG